MYPLLLASPHYDKIEYMKKLVSAALIILFFSGVLCGCYGDIPVPEQSFSPPALPTAEPIDAIAQSTFAPAPTGRPTPEPAPAPEPTPVPKAEGPYQSSAYPLTPKSRRTQAGGMYPEESRLNHDPNKFKCVVDLVNQCVFIYERDEGGSYTKLVREMIASCGTAENPTPVGTFKMQNDYKRFGYFVRFYCYAQYWSLVVNRIYFHSIPYLERDARCLDVHGFYQLGSPASHGCIRLLPDDAHWVYLYLCPGTTVEITKSRPRDEQLRARLLNISLPSEDGYEIG